MCRGSLHNLPRWCSFADLSHKERKKIRREATNTHGGGTHRLRIRKTGNFTGLKSDTPPPREKPSRFQLPPISCAGSPVAKEVTQSVGGAD